MNRLSEQKRAQVVAAFVEGNSIRATVRMTGVAKNTVVKLLCDLGYACADYHNKHVRGLKVRRLQADEIWCFVGSKKKNASDEKKSQGWGDAWTWVAIDADTKLCVSYYVGGQSQLSAYEFMQDAADRVTTRLQLTTDGNRKYLEAVEGSFGFNVDYAMLEKHYGPYQGITPEMRYSPAKCIGCTQKRIYGKPDPEHVSTSFVERQNLTMRMSMRRFTRLTNAFSKKLANLKAAIALHFLHYNYIRVHQTLRVTPAMEAGLTDHPWSIQELIALTENKAASAAA